MDIGQALAGLGPAVWMRTVPWAYPTVETLHILGLALLFGSIALVDLRIIGVSRAVPVTSLLRHALPFTWLAFGVAIATGSLLFVAHAPDLIGNRVFVIKMCLIFAAGINAAIFHTGPYARVEQWNVDAHAPPAARCLAVTSLLIWVGVITCGRWIAYA